MTSTTEFIPASTIYTFIDQESGEISFSAYPHDHPFYKGNHVVLSEFCSGEKRHQPALSMIQNIFRQSGIQVIIQ